MTEMIGDPALSNKVDLRRRGLVLGLLAVPAIIAIDRLMPVKALVVPDPVRLGDEVWTVNGRMYQLHVDVSPTGLERYYTTRLDPDLRRELADAGRMWSYPLRGWAV